MLLLMWIIYLLSDVYGHVALKMASSNQGLFGTLFSFWGISAGIAWIITVVSWTFVLSKSQLLTANATSAITYVLISLAAVVIFREELTLQKAVGVLCVFLGVWLVNR